MILFLKKSTYVLILINQANQTLREALELTVPKEEAGEVKDQTLLGVLSLFGNDDLAFVVTEEMNKRKK